MVKTRFFGVIMILAILLTACGQQNANAIMGKWQSSLNGGIIEFADNSVYRVFTPDGITIDGSYKFTDSNTVQITVPDEWGGTYSIDVSISGDTLTIAVTEGSSTFTRVK